MLAIRQVVGLPIDYAAELRAIVVARRLTHAELAAGGNGFRALALVATLDVLDFWLDGCTQPQLHAQWARIETVACSRRLHHTPRGGAM